MLDHHGHLTECALVSYLAGDVDDASAEQLEAHVADCTGCADRLQSEAQLETLLFEAAEAPEEAVVPLRRRWERVGVAATAVLSMAAALVLVLGDPARFIELHLGADTPANAVLASDGVTPVSDTGTCLPPADDGGSDCEPDELYALATFPTPLATFPDERFDAVADRAPLCEDEPDSGGPMCLDG